MGETNTFIHLRLHTEFSIVDSTVRVSEKKEHNLIDACRNLKFPAVAITDDSNLFVMVPFYKHCISKGIKPIIGSEIKVRINNEIAIIALYAMNQQGYQQLCRIISKAHLSPSSDNSNTIEIADLQNQCNHLIALCGGVSGCLANTALYRPERINQEIEIWKNLFKNRFYLEIHRCGIVNEEKWIDEAVAISQQHNIPLVATNRVCFVSPDDYRNLQAKVCINKGLTLGSDEVLQNYTEFQYLRSSEEMQKLFSDLPSAIQNTEMIARRCNLQISLDHIQLPKFPIPDQLSSEQYLAKKSTEGLKKRLSSLLRKYNQLDEQVYWDRLTYELKVINEMNFNGYFLIVADFIAWAKEHRILVGPGRGSGSGSLVAYALEITNIDPLKFGLFFERFLNIERQSMPDFDIDFCMNRRDEVVDYVCEKYGSSKVAQIITFGTLGAKVVVRDVARILGLPYIVGDRIAKLIPNELGITLAKAKTLSAEFKQHYEADEEIRTVVDLAESIEGLVRNVGRHAAGIVIAPDSFDHFCPLYQDKNNKSNLPMAQFEKDSVEKIGLVKFDFLGLKTLTVIDWAVDSINEKFRQNEKILDIEEINYDDSKVYKRFSEGDTIAVFQLESKGIKSYIKRLSPTHFNDIVDMLALYRPGPLGSGMVDEYIKCKNKEKSPQTFHPLIDDIVIDTQGVIIYQEQVMQIAQKMANYSMGNADILRQAMGKKNLEKMQEQKAIFIKGALVNEVDELLAENLFAKMEEFAEYGFNKAHSVAYAMIAYQTCWLKLYYPAAFYAATMTADGDNIDRLIELKKDAQDHQIILLPVCINRSEDVFIPVDEKSIYWSIAAIKGIGSQIAKDITNERKENGLYKDIFDFCIRLCNQKIGKKGLEILIYVGAFDSFNVGKILLLHNVEFLINYAEQYKKNEQIGQSDLFSDNESTSQNPQLNKPCQEIPLIDLLRIEKKLIGINHHHSEYQIFHEELQKYNVKNISYIYQHIHQKKSQLKNNKIYIFGEIEKFRLNLGKPSKGNKNSQKKAIKDRYEIKITDGKKDLEVQILDPQIITYIQEKELMQKENLVIFTGKIKWNALLNEVTMYADVIETIEEFRHKSLKELNLQSKTSDIKELYNILQYGIKNKDNENTLAVKCSIKITNDTGQLDFNCQQKIYIDNNFVLKLHDYDNIKSHWVVDT